MNLKEFITGKELARRKSWSYLSNAAHKRNLLNSKDGADHKNSKVEKGVDTHDTEIA